MEWGPQTLGTDAMPGMAHLTPTQRCQILYMQFVASLLCSLPFIFENDPLLIIYECNQFLALMAGTLLPMEKSKEEKNKARASFPRKSAQGCSPR